jgi:Zn-dependent protease
MLIIERLFALVLALTLHEFMHGFVGFKLGDDTAKDQGRLTLNPAAHIDPFTTLILPAFLILVGSPIVFGAAKPVPFNPWALRYGKWGAALVALAGPLTNLSLGVFFALWLRFVEVPASVAQFFVILIITNLAFFVFNMIPFPPLDGSRVLYAMVPYNVREVMDRIERAGFMAIAVFIVLFYGAIGGLMSTVITWMLDLLLPGASLG